MQSESIRPHTVTRTITVKGQRQHVVSGRIAPVGLVLTL